MKKQKVMSQMKRQDKTLEKLNEMDIGNLPEKELKVMIVKIIQDLGGKKMEAKIEKMQKNVFQRPRRTNEQTNRNE